MEKQNKGKFNEIILKTIVASINVCDSFGFRLFWHGNVHHYINYAMMIYIL